MALNRKLKLAREEKQGVKERCEVVRKRREERGWAGGEYMRRAGEVAREVEGLRGKIRRLEQGVEGGRKGEGMGGRSEGEGFSMDRG